VCPKEDCKLQLSSMSNLKRHVKRHGERGDSWKSLNLQSREVKNYPFPKPCCGKVFESPSRLVKHLDDVHCKYLSPYCKYFSFVCTRTECLIIAQNDGPAVLSVGLVKHLISVLFIFLHLYMKSRV
jgi:hypothetical protein